MYIRLFDQFVRLGGNPEVVQHNSPIERTIFQFYGRRSPLRSRKAIPRTASTLSENESPDSILNSLDRTPWNLLPDTIRSFGSGWCGRSKSSRSSSSARNSSSKSGKICLNNRFSGRGLVARFKIRAV